MNIQHRGAIRRRNWPQAHHNGVPMAYCASLGATDGLLVGFGAASRAPIDFLRHGSDVQRVKRKRSLAVRAARDLRRLWRIGDPNIPCQVASPQSLTPFFRAKPDYRAET